MNRSTLRYSIAFMLFACLCVAGFLAGNRTGYQYGYASGKAKRQAEEAYPMVYEAGDIIRATDASADDVVAQLDYGPLVNAIQTCVFPAEWDLLGGPCTMTAVPHLESLVVNATSGVHDRLQTFLADLSTVKRAVVASRREQEDMRRAREKSIAGIIRPVSEKLGMELKLTGNDIDIIGTWDIQRNTPSGMTSGSQYVFVDADTVRISTPDNSGKSMATWYFVSPGSVVISGNAYIAATTKDDELVLIPNNDALKFMVASRVGGEP